MPRLILHLLLCAWGLSTCGTTAEAVALIASHANRQQEDGAAVHRSRPGTKRYGYAARPQSSVADYLHDHSRTSRLPLERDHSVAYLAMD